MKKIFKIAAIIMLTAFITACSQTTTTPAQTTMTAPAQTTMTATAQTTMTPEKCSSMGCSGGVAPDKSSQWLYTTIYGVQYISLDIIGNNVSGSYVSTQISGMSIKTVVADLEGSIRGNVLYVCYAVQAVQAVCGNETITALFTNGSLLVMGQSFVPSTYDNYIQAVKNLCNTWQACNPQ